MTANRGRIGARGWGLAPFGLLLAGSLLGSQQADPVALRLEPGRPIERTLARVEVHEYAISLTCGQFLDLVVDPRGINVAIEVEDPDGQRILSLDGPTGAYGAEEVFVTAAGSGSYRLLIKPSNASATSGQYQIRIKELRGSGPADRLRVSAQAAAADGFALEKEQTTDSRRRAIARYEKALPLWRAAADRRGEAVTLFALGDAHRNRGDFLRASNLLERALVAARVAGDRQLEGKTLHRIGNVKTFTGNPREALELLGRSLSIARSVGDRETEAESLNTFAWANWSLGEYQKTLDYAEQALAVCRAAEHRWEEAWAWFEMGFAYWALAEPRKALDSYGRSLRLWRALGERQRESMTLLSTGLVYWKIGAYRRALEIFQEVLPIARELGDQHGEALALNGIGLVQAALGDPSSAQENLKKALLLCRALQDRWAMAYVLYNLGGAYEARGESESAIAVWNEALRLGRELGNRGIEASALSVLARLRLRRGELAEARSEIESAVVVLEFLRGELAEESLRSSFLSSSQDAYAIDQDVLIRLHEADPHGGYDRLAFRASEQGRARALAEAVTEAGLDLSGDLPKELRRREKETGERIHQLEKESLTTRGNHAALESRLAEAEEDWDRLIAEMRRRTPRYASLRYPEPVSFEAVSPLLDSAAALVSYSITTDCVLVFVLTSRRLEVQRLAVSPDVLKERVENYVGLIARDDRDRWNDLAGRLYADLVGPWRKRNLAGIRRLVIVADGVLHSLPFEVLSPPGPARRSLVEDFSISYSPSATIFTQLAKEARSSQPSQDSNLLVLSSPGVASELARAGSTPDGEGFDLAALPFAAIEARKVLHFGGRGSESLSGAAASERLKRGDLERFRVLHFATHALLDTRVPTRSALLLASGRGKGDEGLLTAREIYRLKLGSDLVVLSACRTARGQILPGEGVQGLAQAFFHAGARSVVASLWDVKDRRTADFMAAFYRHLSEGQSKAEALRDAKLDLLRREPRLGPRYWASFVLIGDPMGRVPLLRPRPPLGWSVAGVVGISLTVWVFSRRRRRRISGAA